LAYRDEAFDKKELVKCVFMDDKRISYNALWIISHVRDFSVDRHLRDDLIDCLLSETHPGKKRLLLTILERQKFTEENLRMDFLDFCLSRINCDSESCAVRVLCVKCAFRQCEFYPELLDELNANLTMIGYKELPPGLRNVLKVVLSKLNKAR